MPLARSSTATSPPIPSRVSVWPSRWSKTACVPGPGLGRSALRRWPAGAGIAGVVGILGPVVIAAHLICIALACVGIGALIFREGGARGDWFVAVPLVLFELMCAKAGFDRSGVRGAMYGAVFGAFAAGLPALLLAMALVGHRTRAAAITMAVVYIQWCGSFALFGHWREAGVAALGVGTAWLAKRLDSPEVDRWIRDHLAGLALITVSFAAYPALVTVAMLRVWTPNAATVSLANAAYPGLFSLGVLSLVPVVLMIRGNQDSSRQGGLVAASLGVVIPLALAWSFPVLLAPRVAAAALVASGLGAVLGTGTLVLSSAAQPTCRP